MAFILESVWEWAMAHVLGKCLSVQVPDEFGALADPQTVYEHLYSDGVRNWGAKSGLHYVVEKSPGFYKGVFHPV